MATQMNTNKGCKLQGCAHKVAYSGVTHITYTNIQQSVCGQSCQYKEMINYTHGGTATYNQQHHNITSKN